MSAPSVSTMSLLVCDDSMVARKQVLRALPANWPVTVTEASDGRQAMVQLTAAGLALDR